jgi:hypothetical protein
MFSAFGEFWSHVPWFKRLWIVQEVVLSQKATLVYGASEASLDDIIVAKRMLDQMDRGDSADQPGAGAACQSLWPPFAVHFLGMDLIHQSERGRKVNDVALFNFLHEVRFSQATDPKDKILGLFTLLTQAGIPLSVPDYMNSTADIYRGATIAVIQTTGSLRILEQVDSLGSTSDLVSWAPDWSASKHCLSLDNGCPEAPWIKPYFRFSENNRHLSLREIKIDEIAKSSSWCLMHPNGKLGEPKDYMAWTKNPPPPDAYWQEMLETHPQHSEVILYLINIRALQDFLEMTLDTTPHVAKEGDILALYHALMNTVTQSVAKPDEGYAREWFATLHRDIFPGHQNPNIHCMPTNALYMPINAAWSTLQTITSNGADEKALFEELRSTQEYATLVRISRNIKCALFHNRIVRARYKTVCKLARSGIGIGPWPIRAGDEIALFAGIRMPVVICRVGDKYKLVGHVFIRGAMLGEAWPVDESRLQEFILI